MFPKPRLAARLTSLLFAVPLIAHAAHTSYRTEAPEVDGADIAMLDGASADAGNIDRGDDAATFVAGNRPVQGQTFQTGDHPGGYTLSAVTVQHVPYLTGWDIDGIGDAGTTIRLRVGKVSGDRFSEVTSETANLDGPGNPGDGDATTGTSRYLTFLLEAPLTLAPGTIYGFDLSRASDGDDFFFELNGTRTADAYPDGRAFSTGQNGTPAERLTPLTGDRVFHLDLEPVADSTTTDTETRYLSGTGADDTVPWEFLCTGGRRSGEWTTIPVPSCWELQGFGSYNYGHDPDPASEQGLYRHTFDVPAEWKGRNIQLVFEGAMTDAEVKVNGTSAGAVHQGAFYPFRFNVGSLLRYGGPNLLEVTVSKRSRNASVNSAERAADYWVFGGIFRPVRLEARPRQALQRVAIDAQADGDLTVIAHAHGIGEPLEVRARVEDVDGNPVGEPFSAPLATWDGSATLSTRLPEITPWTMENPALYQLAVELRRGEEVLHRLRERFGFRSVEIRPGDGLYLNGTKIRIKGINRHVFHPEHGRTSSRALSEEAVALIKGLNMNALRMSHYPPDTHLLEICDEEGLLVIDEITGWQSPPYDTPTARRVVREMVERDVNHPSIILWANGNEGGWNPDVDGDFHLHDPQKRPVIHPSTNWKGDIAFGGLDTTHYPTYPTLVEKLAGPNLYLPTEFLHGLYDGGHGAGLQDFWDAMRASPKGVGGFLWVFADEGVRRTDQNGRIDNDGNHAPDGLVGPYNEKEPSYEAVREIWSPVVLSSPSITPRWDGSVAVLNDYHFTPLDRCLVRWEVGDFPTLDDGEATGFKVASSGEFTAPPVAPQARGTMKVPLPDGWQDHDAVRLKVVDPHGRELRQWTWPLRSHENIAAANLPEAPDAAADATEDDDTITLSSEMLSLEIGKATGRITEVIANGKPVSLSDGPRLASGDAELQRLTRRRSGDDPVVEASYEGALRQLTYTLRGDGWLRIDYELEDAGKEVNAGLTFDYPQDRVTGMRWLGGGPQPVWANRLAGTPLGVWEKSANDPIPGRTYIEAPVFRGYHRDLHWALLETTEGPIRIVAESPDLFLRVLTPTNGPDPKNTQFTMPSGDLSLLHRISAIGTKFHAVENLGPTSAPGGEPATHRGSFWLHFAGEAP